MRQKYVKVCGLQSVVDGFIHDWFHAKAHKGQSSES